MAAKTIDFYFDFSSPYGYIASTKIDALAAKHGREARWRPFLLGAAFKQTGGQPLTDIPIKGKYSARDMVRTAKFMGVDYRQPSTFPIGTVAAARAFYWADAKDPERARDVAKSLYRAYFVDDVNIGDAEKTVEVCARLGFDAAAVRAGLADQSVKDRLRAEVDAAIALGAFGSPYIVVDGEPFWGSDRLEQVDRWLASGGW
ncbi:MAG TPA: 2-hydroxychromene-2-carboxylate isomerase [Burkholderiales bacterium]|nr:2-hydroxychromene-2-carboxylate isomerase [Burkholderiales bacterium]